MENNDSHKTEQMPIDNNSLFKLKKINIDTDLGADACAFHTRTDRLGEEVVAQQLQVQRSLCVTPSADVFSLDEEGQKTLLVFCFFPPSSSSTLV